MKTISAEEYKKLEEGKQIHVSITVDEAKKRIRLRYTFNGKNECKEIRYTRIGLEEAMKKAKEMKEDIEKRIE